MDILLKHKLMIIIAYKHKTKKSLLFNRLRTYHFLCLFAFVKADPSSKQSIQQHNPSYTANDIPCKELLPTTTCIIFSRTWFPTVRRCRESSKDLLLIPFARNLSRVTHTYTWITSAVFIYTRLAISLLSSEETNCNSRRMSVDLFSFSLL